MPNLSIPRYLEPPTQAERDHIALIEDDVRAKAVSMMRKQIGVARMKEQYQQLTQNGVEDLTARKAALLNNVDFLFADNPETIAKLQQNDEAIAIKARAQSQLDNYHEHLNDLRRQRNEETMQHNMAMEDLRAGSGSNAVEPYVKEFEGKKFVVNPKTGAIHPLTGTIGPTERLKLQDLYKESRDLRTQMATASGKRFADLQLRRANVDKSIRDLSGDTSATTQAASAAAPTESSPAKTLSIGSVISQNGKKYRFKGGDQSDASNYEEIQ